VVCVFERACREGVEECTGVADEVPKSRRVDENKRDGSLRLEEYW
jgi:hypothetical protein